MKQRMFPEGSLETKILIVTLNLKHLQNFRLGLGALICKIEKKFVAIRERTQHTLKLLSSHFNAQKKIKWKGKILIPAFRMFRNHRNSWKNLHTTTQVAKEKIPLKCDTVINKYGWNFFRLHEPSLCSNFCPLNEPFISFLKEPQTKPRKTSLQEELIFYNRCLSLQDSCFQTSHNFVISLCVFLGEGYEMYTVLKTHELNYCSAH